VFPLPNSGVAVKLAGPFYPGTFLKDKFFTLV
jgi:hypothetical protein